MDHIWLQEQWHQDQFSYSWQHLLKSKVLIILSAQHARQVCIVLATLTILIRHGQQEIVFAGGGEETHWTMSILFDAMGALSSKYNETPEVASRAYDSELEMVLSLEEEQAS